MKALIDADIFQHEFGNATNDEGVPLSWPFVQARVQGRIEKIIEASKADSYQLYLTSDDKSNFRFKVATIRPYKGNRKGLEKPRYYNHIRNFLKDHRDAIEVHGMEADDAISIEQWKDYEDARERHSIYLEENSPEAEILEDSGNSFSELAHFTCATTICSRDKDLHMVPGYHYGWSAGKQKEQPIWWQDEFNGLKLFYKQILTGDNVDNIPGLFGVGKSAQCVRDIDSCTTIFDIYTHVYGQYFNRYGSYAEQFLTENARLLWMLQEEGQIWEPPFSKEVIEEEILKRKEEKKVAKGEG